MENFPCDEEFAIQNIYQSNFSNDALEAIQWKPATKNLHFPKLAKTGSYVNGN